MSLLGHFDVALLMDSQVTIGGNIKTLDRTRHGIHATLGDGVTGGTWPTWDVLNSKYTFDGDDYMNLGSADDAGILDNLGGIPETDLEGECYLFYFSPFKIGSSGTHCFFCKNPAVVSSVEIRMLVGASTSQLTGRWLNEIGQLENVITNTDTMRAYDGKELLMALQRRLNRQEIWFNAGLSVVGAGTSRDAKNSSDAMIGYQSVAGQYMPADTGLRFFGYAQRALDSSQFRKLNSNLRSLL